MSSDQLEKSDAGANLVVSKDRTPVEVGEKVIVLTALEGWEDLGDRQQKYLYHFARDPFNRTSHAMSLGYSISEVDRWFGEGDFSKAASQIRRVYTEILKAQDYKDALHNSKIRARVIKANEGDGTYKEKKEGDKHVHFHDNDSFKDYAKLLQE